MTYTIPNLRPLLAPRSIAIVGASSDPEKAISKYVHQLLSNGYSGKIYPINPKHETLYGYKCYPGVKDIPGEVDSVSIALKREDVPGSLRQCAEKGVRTAVVFSAGFAETGEEGRKLQESITRLSRETGMRILGPNCNGVINVNDHTVNAMFFYSDMKEKMIPGNISLVSQSGTIPLICFANGHERGIGYRCLISLGNEADLDISDVMGFMIDDDQTRVVTGYVEGIKDVDKFRDMIDLAHSRKKPVILLHASRHKASLLAAKSHTGAFTDQSCDFGTLFREKGVVTVDEPDDLMELGVLFSSPKKPRGGRIGVMNTTGGLTVLTADIGAEIGLEYPRFSDPTYEMFKELLKFGAPNNPIDLTGQVANDPVLFKKAIRAFVEDERMDIVVASMFLWRSNLEYRIDSLVELSKETEKPIVVIWVGANIGGESARKLLKAGIPVFRNVRTCLKGIKSWIEYNRFTERR